MRYRTISNAAEPEKAEKAFLLTLVCSKCGCAVRSTDKFCAECGRKLTRKRSHLSKAEVLAVLNGESISSLSCEDAPSCRTNASPDSPSTPKSYPDIWVGGVTYGGLTEEQTFPPRPLRRDA